MSLFGTNTQNNTSSLFGSANKPTIGFGSNTNASNSVFGAANTNASNSVFGAANTNTGSSLFGKTNTQSTSLFGNNNTGNTSLFGSNATPNKPTSLFGTPQTQTNSLFGQTNNTNTFGAKPAATTSSIFGATPTTSSSSLFGNNNQASTTSLFGTNNQTGTTSLFGNTNQAGSNSLFGTNNNNNNNQTGTTSLFGTNNNAQASTNSFGFGSTQNSLSLFGNQGNNAFKTTNTGTLNSGLNQNKSLFGTNTLQQNTLQPAQNNPAQPNVDAFYISLSQPCIFGDDRDSILAKFNQLLAMWASDGQGFCSMGSVTYSKDNVFSRFKGIVYNFLPTSTDEDGLVKLTINQPCETIIKNSQQIKEALFRILESKPNIVVEIEEIRPSFGKNAETECELIFKVIESRMRTQGVDASNNLPTNSGQIISASTLSGHLNSQNLASQLSTQLSVTSVSPVIAPSQVSLNTYLKTPPIGFDKMVWQQFIKENPRPDCLLPVPLLGLNELKLRKKEQIAIGNQQNRALSKIGDSLRQIEAKNAVISQKIFCLKSKQFELCHRILKVIAKKEVARKSGFAISTEEEMLRGNLEKTITQLKSVPSNLGQYLNKSQVIGISNGGLRQRMSAIMSAVNDIEKNSKQLQNSELDVGIEQDTTQELVEYLANKSRGINQMRLMTSLISEKISIMSNYTSGSTQFYNSNQMSFDARRRTVTFATK